MIGDEPGQEPTSEDDPRLSSLKERLESARLAEEVRIGKVRGKPEKGYSQGNRVLAELIAGLAGGSLLGWLFDRWLGTSPWLLIVMLFLGTAVAFRNIVRISNERPE